MSKISSLEARVAALEERVGPSCGEVWERIRDGELEIASPFKHEGHDFVLRVKGDGRGYNPIVYVEKPR